MGVRTQKSIDKIVAAFNTYHPQTCIDAEALCHITLLPAPNQGMYRDTYFIRGVPLVVKFPKNNGGTHSHARAEIKAIRRLKKGKHKYRLLQNYIPEIYYGNLITGVIVMKRYKSIKSKYSEELGELMSKLVSVVWPDRVGENDLCGANLAVDEKGQIKIIDLGYFTKEGHDYESGES